MKPAHKTALKIAGSALAIVVLAGSLGIYLSVQLRADPNELALGALAPQVELIDTEGQPFSLATLGQQGQPVLVFYRGHW